MVNGEGEQWTTTDGEDNKYYGDQQCNIYGGCYTSGTTIGGIDINVYSDLLHYDVAEGNDLYVDKRAVINSINDKSWRNFSIVGAGYGSNTAVYGNIAVRMLPSVDGGTVTSPSAATIFGGSQKGLVVGNTTVELRQGKVLANLYGASEAAKMYGSTQVIVGYPEYYEVKQTGIYALNRTDYLSDAAVKNADGAYDGQGLKDAQGEYVVPKTVAYREGDIVGANVVEIITGCAKAEDSVKELGEALADGNIDVITGANLDTYFEHIVSKPSDYGDGISWDDIEIWIGDQGSNQDPKKTYYGHGNIYGGGFIPNSTDKTLIGESTVMRFTDDYQPLEERGDNKSYVRYGGNASVLIWDNKENASMAEGSSSPQLKDHVHLGTGRFIQVETDPAKTQAGLFEKVKLEIEDSPDVTHTEEAYVFQTNGRMVADHEYYRKEADGGLYGGGRKVFVEGFRAIDLGYYGYAEHSPQSPKLLNTIQRADLVSVRDCCMELVGASDFTVNDYKDIYYAINRVGELRMESSLNPDQALDVGVAEVSSGIRLHNTKRSRNYMALYNKTNHLAALRSNWTFEHKYHGDDGAVSNRTESNYGYPSDNKESYVNHKHRFVDLYTAYYKLKQAKGHNPIADTDDELVHLYDLYQDVTGKTLSYSTGTLFVELEQAIAQEFEQRNVATSGNMLGISSGYELSLEGLACQRGEEKESRYYGPIYGIVEMKLLTVVSGMGGGYVYALNHHYDPNMDNSSLGRQTNDWCKKWGQDFLMTTGNFVFPGASYINSDNKDKHNFIIDDCYDLYDPLNHGYYACDGHDRHIIRAPRRDGGTSTSTVDVNHSHEIHYWYVKGNSYVFNVTITGITSDTEEKPRSFYMSNENGLVSLFSVNNKTEITVKEVSWFAHDDHDLKNCDLLHEDDESNSLDTHYELYLTVDHNARNDYTDKDMGKNGVYAIRIPRFQYERAVDSENAYVNNINGANRPDFGVTVNPNPFNKDAVFFDNYSDDTGTHANVPLLGIRLVDGQNNRLADQDRQAGLDYYNSRLKEPHNLQVVLEAREPGKTETFQYFINITIKYLLGPAIFGNVEIENCALPGEMVYVNANNVEVLCDENLGTASQSWKIYPINPEHPDQRITDSNTGAVVGYDIMAYQGSTVPDGVYPESNLCIDSQNDKLLHIPAYYYMNGWEVAYVATVNGEEFEATLPYYLEREEEDSNDPTQTVTVKTPLPENRLQVHNYHRMKPRYNVDGKPIDLRFVPGARIYIEDDEDLKEYLEYHNRVNYAEVYTPNMTASGQEIDPKNGVGLNFMLMNHVTVPVFDAPKEIVLGSRFHGNGRIVTIPDSALLNLNNKGEVYNTGFVSEVADDNTVIFDTNTGRIQNCYYFNTGEKGSLAAYDASAKVYNCYQNTAVDSRYKYNQMMRMSSQAFKYGQVAYNLNSFYLQKRHILLHGPNATDAWHTDNNSFDLAAKDVKLRKKKTNYSDYEISYIERMFNNGDYRYAFYKLPDDYTQFTEALRTAEQPNYMDYLGQHGNGKPVSMHDYSHKVDEARWCETHQEYHPLFDVDYLFFGQNLTIDVDHANETLPESFSPANRVYRVGGFYGSAADKGYYFNRQAYLDSPLMTAIDFVGYRDRELYDSNTGNLIEAYRKQINANGWLIRKGWHEVFCAPTMDLPWVEEGGVKHHDFVNLSVNSDKVTHNLLIYTRDNDKASTYVSDFHYDQDFQGADPQFQYHSEAGIRGHHIVDVEGGTPRMYGDYFHLVDGHDFNAPVAFEVKQGWYTRQPAGYAQTYSYTGGKYVESLKTAWDVICLPFTVEKTYAATSDRNKFSNDMGEITHFFDEEEKGHEYWLRRLVGIASDNQRDVLCFERPTEGNKGDAADVVHDLVYSNSTIRDLYHDAEYQDEHDELYHGDNKSWSRTIKDYRYLTAGVPYIVAYPGENYYEFDLSGRFYASLDPDKREVVPQSITYFVKQNVDDNYATIPVSDEIGEISYSVGGSGSATASDCYVMRGGFKHASNNESDKSAVCDYVADLYVLNDDGTEFDKASANTRVAPFRAYVYKTSSGGSRSLVIGGDRTMLDETPEIEEPDEPEQPADELAPGIEIWVEDHALMIRTPYDIDLYIYNLNGQAVRHIRAYEGLNRYTGLSKGFYIAGGYKFAI